MKSSFLYPFSSSLKKFKGLFVYRYQKTGRKEDEKKNSFGDMLNALFKFVK